jgi:hypothetical protein
VFMCFVRVCIILSVFLSSYSLVFSQKVANKYSGLQQLRTFDQQKFHFGFSLGFNQMRYKVSRPLPNLQLPVVESNPRPGFDIGLVSVYHISKNLKLRFTPVISFQDNLVEYTFLEGNSFKQETQQIEPTFIYFPLLLKIRTNRINNFASAILLGAQYGMDAASQKDKVDTKEVQFLKTTDRDFAAIVGVGFDFFLEYFKFGLEIKYNHGFNNMLLQDNNRYSSPLDYLKSRLWTFTITFEG